MQSEEQNETIEVEKEERQIEHQNEECSKDIEQNSHKNNVNDSGKKPKGQSNRKNGKPGSIEASANEASKRKSKTILVKVTLRALQHHRVS